MNIIHFGRPLIHACQSAFAVVPDASTRSASEEVSINSKCSSRVGAIHNDCGWHQPLMAHSHFANCQRTRSHPHRRSTPGSCASFTPSFPRSAWERPSRRSASNTGRTCARSCDEDAILKTSRFPENSAKVLNLRAPAADQLVPTCPTHLSPPRERGWG